MLFRKLTLERIADRQVTLAFRRWSRPSVRPGGRLRTPAGELAIDDVRIVAEADITEGEACRAGFADRSELLRDLAARDNGAIHRIAFRFLGPDDRQRLRRRRDGNDAEGAAVLAALERLDRRSRSSPWTARILAAIADGPGRRAEELALECRMEKSSFKRRVRQLGELGLTESLQTGYRLSPRGRSIFERLQADRRT